MEISRTKKTILTIGAILSLILLVIAGFWAAKHLHETASFFENFDKLREYILSFGGKSFIVYIFFQWAQVMLPAVPTEAVQSVGGYIFGLLFGVLLSMAGILLGEITAFYAVRILGVSFFDKVVSPKNKDKLGKLFDTPKANTIIFLIYLIPGMPKDVMNYIAGISPIKPQVFFTVSILARLPGTVASVYLGTTLLQKNYTAAAVIFLGIIILVAAGYLVKRHLSVPSKNGGGE